MKTVFEIVTHHNDAEPVIKIVEKLPARIGRAYDNDVVLQDPYVSAYHAVVDYDAAADRLVLADLGSENGIEWQGDRVLLGQTRIRFFDAALPVAPAQKLRRKHPFLEKVGRPWVVWLIYAATIAASIGWTYLEVWSEEVASAVAIGGVTVAALILLWAGAWSLVGRVARHRAMFTGHLLIGSVYVFVSSLLMIVQNYIDFVTNENMLSTIFSYVFTALTMAPLMYGALTLSTALSKRQRTLAALFFAGGIMAGTMLFSFVGQKNFDQAPNYPPVLEPYFSTMLPAKTLASFTAENKQVFKSKVFEQVKDK